MKTPPVGRARRHPVTPAGRGARSASDEPRDPATTAGRAATSGNARSERRDHRRLLFVLWLLPVVFLLVTAARVGLLAWDDHSGRAAFADGRASDARTPFARNAILQPFEPWVAPYDEGSAALVADDPADARDRLDVALTLVPPAQECRVRINLALAHEQLAMGNANEGDLAAAQAALATARSVLIEGGCLDEQLEQLRNADLSPKEWAEDLEALATQPEVQAVVEALSTTDKDTLEERSETATQVERRLREDLRKTERLADRLKDRENQGQEPEDPRVEELEQRNDRGEDQRDRDAEQRDRDEDEPGTITW